MIWLISLMLACALLFLHPYTTFPLSLSLFPRQAIVPQKRKTPKTAALFFCAYNEERALPAKLANIETLKRAYPWLKVYAYSDCSTDRTKEMLQARSDILTPVIGTERLGKATGMKLLVAMSKEEIAIFTDANVELDVSSLARLMEYFSDTDIGGVAGTLHYINSEECATAKVGSLYWRLEEWIKKRETRVGSMMGADGSCFAVRRALYPDVPPHLLDDLIVSMSPVFAGMRLVSAPDVIAYERTTTSASDEFRRKRRIACRAFNTYRYLSGQIGKLSLADRYKFISHKVLRWFGAPILITGATSGTLAMVLSGRGLIALAFWIAGGVGWWIGSRHSIPVVSQAVEILNSIVATFVGVIDALRGLTYQTWKPAESR